MSAKEDRSVVELEDFRMIHISSNAFSYRCICIAMLAPNTIAQLTKTPNQIIYPANFRDYSLYCSPNSLNR